MDRLIDYSIILWVFEMEMELSDRLETFLQKRTFYKNNELLCALLGLLPILPGFSLYLSTIFLLYLFKVLFDIFAVLFGVLYVLARIYLVVISFINLAHLPDSAYLLPQWSRYVPHIG